MIAVLSGGVGAARMLRALALVVPAEELVAIVNTADDLELYGLSISPDLDTVTYTLAGAVNEDTRLGSPRGVLLRAGCAWSLRCAHLVRSRRP